jgi:hypothetical protein
MPVSSKGESQVFLLPPRSDGPIVQWTSLLAAGTGALAFIVLRWTGMQSKTWIVAFAFGFTLLGSVFGAFASRAYVDIANGRLRAWKSWRFGEPEIVELATVTSVEIETQKLPLFSKRYSLRIRFSDGPDRVIGCWMPRFDTDASRRLFEDLADAARTEH